MGQPAPATRVVRRNALMPPLAGGVGRPAPAPGFPVPRRAFQPGPEPAAMCSTASRIVSPAAWARTSRPSRSTLTLATAGRVTAGSAAIVSVTRACKTGSVASRSSESTFAMASSGIPSGTAPWVSICTCTGCVPCMAHLPSGRVVTGAADRACPPGRHCPVTGNRSRAAIRNGASRIAENCPPSCRVRWTISSNRSGTGCAAVSQSGQPSAATPSRPHRPHT